jgi:hypothetical protein
MHTHVSLGHTDSTPTAAIESRQESSNQDVKLRILNDKTTAQGVRHVLIQTTATGNDANGYKAAERQAHSWFFANYDPINPDMAVEERTILALEITEHGLLAGRVSEHWLDCPHPLIEGKNGKFKFGHHLGINPTEAEPTWGFQFEIVTLESEAVPGTNDVKLFAVDVAADLHVTMSGSVEVYATNADEAVQKIQGQIDDEVLPDDLEMEDWSSGIKIIYGDLKNCDEFYIQTDHVEVVEEDVDPVDVLMAEVEELEAGISWNMEALAKHKAFLTSLGAEQAAA